MNMVGYGQLYLELGGFDDNNLNQLKSFEAVGPGVSCKNTGLSNLPRLFFFFRL